MSEIEQNKKNHLLSVWLKTNKIRSAKFTLERWIAYSSPLTIEQTGTLLSELAIKLSMFEAMKSKHAMADRVFPPVKFEDTPIKKLIQYIVDGITISPSTTEVEASHYNPNEYDNFVMSPGYKDTPEWIKFHAKNRQYVRSLFMDEEQKARLFEWLGACLTLNKYHLHIKLRHRIASYFDGDINPVRDRLVQFFMEHHNSPVAEAKELATMMLDKTFWDEEVKEQ